MEIAIAIFITLFLTIPLLTFLHELGHALAGLAVGASHVSIFLGSVSPPRKTVLNLEFKRTRIALANWTRLWFGSAHMDDTSEIAPRRRALVAIAGPLVSLIIVVILSVMAFLTRKDASSLVRAVVQYTALSEFFTLIMTAIPMRYPWWMGAYAGHKSDMARVLHLLRQEEK